MVQPGTRRSAGGNRKYKPEDWTDFAHTGPETLAGRYMRLFWQPIYRSEDLAPKRAKPIRIMSEDFTLYRGETGNVHLLDFRCAHRGTQLSAGWVEGDCIRCFYHGWKYDGSGQCVEQPAEDPTYAAKISVRSYPTEDYLGLIFAYLGEGDPPPFPRLPDFEELQLIARTYVRPCNYFQHLDNIGDPIHVPFVHGTRWEHGRGNWQPENLVSLLPPEENDFGFTAGSVEPDGTAHADALGMPNIREAGGRQRHHPGGTSRSIRWQVPIDDESHVDFCLTSVTEAQAARLRPRSAAEWEDIAARVNELTFGVLDGRMSIEEAEALAAVDSHFGGAQADVGLFQDTVAQAGQGAIFDRSNEHLGRSDVAVIMRRKLWERELRALAEGGPLKQWTRPVGGLSRAWVDPAIAR